MKWSNINNQELYNKMPIENFRSIAKQCGLADGCDINMISQFINAADSILEIGAGYGRALQQILNNGYKGKLYAIERVPLLYNHLISTFQNNIKVFNMDLLKLKLTQQFDLILWLWTGLYEFSKSEQPTAMSILKSLLNKNGHIVIDLIPPERKANNAIELSKQIHMIETEYGKNYGYFPTPAEINEYANNLDLQIAQKIPYETRTKRKRHLYIFTHK